MPRLLFATLAVLLSWPAHAGATTVMDETKWSVVGFGPNGHVLFRKEQSDGAYGCDEHWLTVLDKTGKRVIAVPVYRVGGPPEDATAGDGQPYTGDGQGDGEEGCAKIKPISKSAGRKEAAKLEKRFGPFKPAEVLKRVKDKDILLGKDLRVALEVKGKIPDLPDDIEAAANLRAHVTAKLILTRGKESSVLWQTRQTLSPGRARQSEHVPYWWLPTLTGGQRSADGALLAVVVDGKPRVFALPPATRRGP